MTNLTSPVRLGASRGIITGIYLAIMFMSSLFLSGTVLDGALTTGMAIVFPFLLYKIMRHDFVATGRRFSVGAMWLEGLTAIMGGALIASTLMFVYLRWIEPDYIATRWAEMTEELASAPDPAMNELAESFKTASANGFAITPIMLTMSMLWMAAFSGSVLSLIVAAVVRAFNRQQTVVNNSEK